MSANEHTGRSTLDIDDFEPVSDGQPEEFEPDDEDILYDDEEYFEEDEDCPPPAFVERLLSVLTIALSLLLTAGSVVFWWYFVSRLSICPSSINNHELYPVMLFTCAAVSLAVTVGQVMRSRTYPTTAGWMVNICASGAISALLMTVYNSVVLGRAFEWMDVVPTVCFSVSGCALPASIFFVVWALILRLIDHVRYENSKDRDAVYADVLALCEGRLF